MSNLQEIESTCKRCGSPHLDEVQVSGGVHHAKNVCRTCGAFQSWAPKPETLEAARAVQKQIEMLLEKSLAPHEAAFLESLRDWIRFRRPTPKQSAWLNSIARRKGGVR